MAKRRVDDFRLADYLRPSGRFEYDRLPGHLEDSLAAGHDVYLWSVPGFFMLAGHVDMIEHGSPWSDGEKWYRSAADCLKGRGGRYA